MEWDIWKGTVDTIEINFSELIGKLLVLLLLLFLLFFVVIFFFIPNQGIFTPG